MSINKSGIYPSGNRVLILPEELEKVTEGGIVVPETVIERHTLAQTTGTLIAVGPDAFTHIVERKYSGKGELLEEVHKGYHEPFAEPGDRIAYARYSGQAFRGADGKKYILTNDEDITGRVSNEVELSDFESRKSFEAHAGLAS